MTKRMQKILLGFSLLLAVPFVVGYGLYYGYCHSWWGKDNLLFRSLWLCSCPAGFEETLYPDYVEVLFSACDWQVEVEQVLSSGEYILVKNDPATPEMPQYLWDTRTDEKLLFPYAYEDIRFLTKDWIVDYRKPNNNEDNVVTNWQTGESMPYRYLIDGEYPEPYLPDGAINPEAKNFFYPSSDAIVILGEEEEEFEIIVIPTLQGEQVFSFMLEDDGKKWLKQFLLDAEIPTLPINHSARSNEQPILLSPNGQYKGLTDLTTKTVVLELPADRSDQPYCFTNCPMYWVFCCWTADSQSIIYRFVSDINGLVIFPRLTTGIPWTAPASGVDDEYPGPIVRVYLPQN